MVDAYDETFTKSALVIDNGSGIMKAGMAGEDKPKLVFSSFIGRPKYKPVLPNSAQTDCYIGNTKEESKGLFKIKYPISHGIITNWNDMDLIWKYIFAESHVNPRQVPVLVTEPPLNPLSCKLTTAQIFFETYSVPAFFMAMQGVLSLFASGKVTGLLLDCGDGVTHCVPIYDGYSLQHAVSRIDLGGRDITEYLMLLLRRSGYSYNTSAEFELVRKIKEKRCTVNPTPQSDEKYLEDKKVKDPYILPDGSVLELTNEKTRAPEILFAPEKIGLEFMGIPELIVNSVSRVDIDLRKTLYSEINLAGGTTMLSGFPERLLNEVRKLVAKELKIKIYAPPERNYLCWLGGSILSNLSSFKDIWISKKEYQEEGERLLLKKSF